MRGRLAGMGAGERSSQKSELIGFYEGLRKKKLKTKKKKWILRPQMLNFDSAYKLTS